MIHENEKSTVQKSKMVTPKQRVEEGLRIMVESMEQQTRAEPGTWKTEALLGKLETKAEPEERRTRSLSQNQRTKVEPEGQRAVVEQKG